MESFPAVIRNTIVRIVNPEHLPLYDEAADACVTPVSVEVFNLEVSEQRIAFTGLWAAREEHLRVFASPRGASIGSEWPRTKSEIRKKIVEPAKKAGDVGVAIRYVGGDSGDFWEHYAKVADADMRAKIEQDSID